MSCWKQYRDSAYTLGEKAEKLDRQKIKGNKKLAKLLGDDTTPAPPKIATPPPPPIQPPPLQRQPSQSQHPYEGRTPLSASFSSIPLPSTETPWYLCEDYAPEEIIFDDKGSVKAGTLRALVCRLTPHQTAGEFWLPKVALC